MKTISKKLAKSIPELQFIDGVYVEAIETWRRRPKYNFIDDEESFHMAMRYGINCAMSFPPPDEVIFKSKDLA